MTTPASMSPAPSSTPATGRAGRRRRGWASRWGRARARALHCCYARPDAGGLCCAPARLEPTPTVPPLPPPPSPLPPPAPQGLIPGFELGIRGMRAGGKRRIIVPPKLGPPVGPSTFFSAKQCEVFDVELREIRTCSRRQVMMFSDVVCE